MPPLKTDCNDETKTINNFNYLIFSIMRFVLVPFLQPYCQASTMFVSIFLLLKRGHEISLKAVLHLRITLIEG